jgi:hypothetical protein
MHTIRAVPLLSCLALAFAAPAMADTYPVSGKWTYENVSGEGPAPECGKRYMSFEGNQRRDTGGGVPSYRNFSVEQNGSSYNVVDEFSTGQITARSAYTLRQSDADHLELKLSAGPTIKLRRCQ